jgi:hypothetical protein
LDLSKRSQETRGEKINQMQSAKEVDKNPRIMVFKYQFQN